MTILDVCDRLADLDDGETLYAERIGGNFQATSEAVVSPAGGRCRVGRLEYCLEVYLAKTAVAVWSRWRDGQVPTVAEQAEAVCHKANYDAWGPPNFPIDVGLAGK